APVKLFLTADAPERARRRAAELRARGDVVDEAALAAGPAGRRPPGRGARGDVVDEAALAADLAARDRRDSGRAESPLRPAADALVLDTSDVPLDEVVARMEAAVRACLAR